MRVEYETISMYVSLDKINRIQGKSNNFFSGSRPRTTARQPKKIDTSYLNVGIVQLVPYANQPPPSTTVDDGDHELPPPQVNHGSGTAVMVQRSTSAVSNGFLRASPMASPFGTAENDLVLTYFCMHRRRCCCRRCAAINCCS